LRLTIVQYGGDYREAFERFARGGKETYHAQRYSVDVVGKLARQLAEVSVICSTSETKYDVLLDNGVRAIGAGLPHGFRPSDLIQELTKTRPTRLSLTTPLIPVLKWANSNRIRTIVPLADSFQKRGVRSLLRHRYLAHCLNRSTIDWVGNHGINACLSLLDIGVDPEKIVPWDWPHDRYPREYAPRPLRPDGACKLLYVGSVTPAKGVGDLLHAVSLLRKSGIIVALSIIGKDPDGSMIALSRKLGLSGVVDFAGVVGNEDVPAAMRAADVVVIPSRHVYPEGLPLTIYEALCTRTPIIASDHPMFRGALIDDESALIFPASNVRGLASSIQKLLSNAALYARLSLRSESVWEGIQLPVKMGAFLEAWISDDPAKLQWIRDHRLTSGKYERALRERRKVSFGSLRS
jgi:glycosyltransferase involved in cell wall biosynthesis